MIWVRVSDTLPLVGERVLTFGRGLPDGAWRVRVERVEYTQHGVPYWSVSDEVSHWCAIEDVPEPEEP